MEKKNFIDIVKLVHCSDLSNDCLKEMCLDMVRYLESIHRNSFIVDPDFLHSLLSTTVAEYLEEGE